MPQPPVFSIVALLPSLLAAQGDPGAALWRVAAQTLAIPPALTNGPGDALWNPAGTGQSRFAIGIEAVQGAHEIGATGVLGGARLRVARVGTLGVSFGRMQLRDLVRTSSSPAPDPGTITYYTQVVGTSWAMEFGPVTFGVAGAVRDSRLDEHGSRRWTIDFGAVLPIGERLRLGGATHSFRPLDSDGPSQDVFGGAEVLAWRGRPWRDGPPSAFALRYGTAFGHGFAADHSVGAGFACGDVIAADLRLAYEGGFAGGGWQPIGAVTFATGKYRVEVAANPGAAGLGPAFRVGLDARIR